MDKFYEIQFEIETACLLDCVHCSSAESRSLVKRQYSVEAILDMLRLFHGKTRIIFTGGEPLLNGRIFKLFKNMDSISSLHNIGIYTTGNLKNMDPIDDTLANRLKNSFVDECYFSIYSISPEVHDKWTRKDGSFFNTLSSIKCLKRVGITPKAHLLLTRDNINVIEEVIYFCESIGLDEVRILRLAPAGNAQINWNDISIPLHVQNDIIERIVSQKNKFKISITVAGYPHIIPCRSFDGARGCQAGIHLLYVDAYGDIYPCACAKSDSMRLKICNISQLDKLEVYLNVMSSVEFREECLNSLEQ